MNNAGLDRDDNGMTRWVLEPVFAPGPTRRGWLVLGLLYSWVWFWFVVGTATGTWDQHGNPVPDPTVARLAVLGVAAVMIVMLGWRLPGIRRLYPAPAPMAVVSDAELELHIPSVGIRVYRWEEIGSLSRGRRGSGLLRSPAGEELVAIPPGLLNGNWCSLARMVVSVRGDRYEVVRSWRFGSRVYFRSRDLPA